MGYLRIADREGWGTVQAYLSGDFVTAAESEKLLRKARLTAQTSRENKKKCTSSHHDEKRTTDSPRVRGSNVWYISNFGTVGSAILCTLSY